MGLTMDICERLSIMRDVLGLTRDEVAKRAGMHPLRYELTERGKRPIDPEDVSRLCSVFNVDPQWLYLGDTSNLDPELARIIEGMLRARQFAKEAMAGVAVRRK
jgi:transcriptional regulator with XRE-family HTH domain